ncbi:hypothetical protein ACFVAV_30880 [Nocardia sp. NPDC057663]|uniref:hypothetical protein n=1 Tax=Nocardia sp. NPDC057663 TaxID=3346201 RepID=UPI00366F732B
MSNTEQLNAATKDSCTREIEIQGQATSTSTIALQPGQRLVGTTGDAALIFPQGIDGVFVSTDNTISRPAGHRSGS